MANSYRPLPCAVKTADGKSQKLFGKLTTKVGFKTKPKELSFYMLPSLSQNLYLGIDLWKTFDLLPFCFQQAELSTLDDPMVRSLSDKQRQQLASTINLFPSFTIKRARAYLCTFTQHQCL